MARDLGRVGGETLMERVVLQLKGSPEQEAALEQFLAEQQDPSSPPFRQWLTPEQSGERFAAARQDVETVAGWLTRRGFRVERVANGRRAVLRRGEAN
jgi:subtilase family serine protease